MPTEAERRRTEAYRLASMCGMHPASEVTFAALIERALEDAYVRGADAQAEKKG